jgi:hypothetical protein
MAGAAQTLRPTSTKDLKDAFTFSVVTAHALTLAAGR